MIESEARRARKKKDAPRSSVFKSEGDSGRKNIVFLRIYFADGMQLKIPIFCAYFFALFSHLSQEIKHFYKQKINSGTGLEGPQCHSPRRPRVGAWEGPIHEMDLLLRTTTLRPWTQSLWGVSAQRPSSEVAYWNQPQNRQPFNTPHAMAFLSMHGSLTLYLLWTAKGVNVVCTSCGVILIMEHSAPPHWLKRLNLCTVHAQHTVRPPGCHAEAPTLTPTLLHTFKSPITYKMLRHPITFGMQRFIR